MDAKDIARVSRRYRTLIVVLLVSVPLSHAAIWTFANQLPRNWFEGDFVIVGSITPLVSLLGFFVSMIKGAIVMYGLWHLQRLFGCYERGIFFSYDTVACFRRLSAALISWVAAGLFVVPLLSLVLTMNNPPGQHVISLSFASADLTALVVGGVLSVIAKVMENGRRLQEEAELTI